MRDDARDRSARRRRDRRRRPRPCWCRRTAARRRRPRAPRAAVRAARRHRRARCPKPRLAAELAHGVGQHLRVRVVDVRRLHRLAGRDDLVAGRDDRDDRLSPDVNAWRRRSPRARRFAAGQHRARAQHRLAGRDVGAGKRDAAAGRHRRRMRSLPSRDFACSTITTASAPRGTIRPRTTPPGWPGTAGGPPGTTWPGSRRATAGPATTPGADSSPPPDDFGPGRRQSYPCHGGTRAARGTPDPDGAIPPAPPVGGKSTRRTPGAPTRPARCPRTSPRSGRRGWTSWACWRGSGRPRRGCPMARPRRCAG